MFTNHAQISLGVLRTTIENDFAIVPIARYFSAALRHIASFNPTPF
jgi:hypothetical protein